MEISDRKKYDQSNNTLSSKIDLSERWQLEVLGGIHQGASVSLSEDELIVIGHAHDCDIVLQDQGVTAHHVAIMVRSNRLVLKPLDGAINLNGCELGHDKMDLIGANKISLANSDVTLNIFNTQASSEDEAKSSSKPKPDRQLNPDKKSNISRMVWVMCTLVLLGALAGTGRFTLAGKDELTSAEPVYKSPELIIDELQLADQLSVSDTNQGTIIKGILTQQQKAQFKSLIQDPNYAVRLNTITPQQLLEQVSNVFRINGYRAQLRYQGGASVAVENLDGSLEAVKKIAAYIKQDVPSLSSLEFDEQPDKPLVDVEPELEIDPDKKMTTIVDGDIAYISTIDGARYFSGSILPGGYTVKKITVEGVKVIRDEQEIWLKF